MRISFVIPAHNEEHYIAKSLHSIVNHPQKGNNQVEIIVVDNNSSDDTARVAKSFAGVKVMREPRKGTMFARQKGFEAASGDYIAFLDADSYLSDQWFETMSGLFARQKDIVCVSGPCKYYDASLHHRAAMNVLWKVSAPLTYRAVGYMILGGNFVAKRDALNAIGGMNTSRIFYGDDTELARRMAQVGQVLFDMNFFIHTSARRFRRQGLTKVCYHYAMNFAWEVIFHKPYTPSHD